MSQTTKYKSGEKVTIQGSYNVHDKNGKLIDTSIDCKVDTVFPPVKQKGAYFVLHKELKK